MPARRPTAALYHRVSTVDQDPNLAGRELHVAARRLGYRVSLDVRETGRGASAARPGLARVMRAARAGEIDAVLVWKLDRFGRSALDLLGHLGELERARVRFVCTTQGLDLDPKRTDATSRLLLHVLAAIAEWERELISERTRLGMAAAKRAGTRLGRPPAPRPPPAQVAKLRAKGMSWPDVAKHLKCSIWAARFEQPRKEGGRRARAVAVKKGGA